jgi:prephenate dehydratase
VSSKNHTSAPEILVLGPASSFTEEAARTIAPDIPLAHANTISDILRKISSGEFEFGIVPLENLLHGPVTETLDTLTRTHLHTPEKAPQILYSFCMPIEHYIGVPSQHAATPLQEIREVYSHPQALAQSEAYIQKVLPGARQIPVSSTSIAPLEAAQATHPAAAIASRNALEKASFSIHGITVSRELQNQTRFGIVGLATNKEKISTIIPATESTTWKSVTSICVHPGKDRKGLLLEILNIISEKHECNMLSIHSRPDTEGGFIFYFEIEDELNAPKVSTCISALNEYCKVQTGSSARLLNFGSYPRTPFKEPLIQSLCIVGAKGKMGTWLSDFFSESGISVLKTDLDSTEKDKKQIAECDAVFLSVPMRNLESAAKEVLKYTTPGTLIVENCSVKTKAIRTLEEIFDSRFETLGIHTMFGPDIDSLKGKNIIISRTQNSGEKAVALENLFYKHGAHIHHATPDEHDKTTAYIQALCQFYALGMADVLNKLNNEIGSSLHHFITPNSERALTSVKRVLSQSSLLTTDLQNENPFAREIREGFIQSLSTLNKILPEEEIAQNKINELATTLETTIGRTLKH